MEKLLKKQHTLRIDSDRLRNAGTVLVELLKKRRNKWTSLATLEKLARLKDCSGYELVAVLKPYVLRNEVIQTETFRHLGCVAFRQRPLWPSDEEIKRQIIAYLFRNGPVVSTTVLLYELSMDLFGFPDADSLIFSALETLARSCSITYSGDFISLLPEAWLNQAVQSR
jgi:hypothetical protein